MHIHIFTGVTDKLFLNYTEHSIAEFLDKLNYNAVLTPLLEFDDAIKARKIIKNPKAQAGAVCGNIISALHSEKNEEKTAVALTEYWKIVPEFEQYVHLQAVETRVSRALLMLSSSKAYSWVISIATEAIRDPTADTWVCQLAKDVRRDWINRHSDPNTPQEAIYNSKDYLPSLTPFCEAILMPKRWLLKYEEENLIHFLTYIIETWLQFPISKHMNNSYKVRCALITITIKHMPLSVLYLDDVWKMYNKPYSFLIHGRPGAGERDRQRISLSHTEETLVLFEKSIQNHVITDSNSKEYLLLMVLMKQSETWFRLTASRIRRETQGTVLNSNVRVSFIVYGLIF